MEAYSEICLSLVVELSVSVVFYETKNNAQDKRSSVGETDLFRFSFEFVGDCVSTGELRIPLRF